MTPFSKSGTLIRVAKFQNLSMESGRRDLNFLPAGVLSVHLKKIRGTPWLRGSSPIAAPTTAEAGWSWVPATYGAGIRPPVNINETASVSTMKADKAQTIDPMTMPATASREPIKLPPARSIRR